MAPSGILQSALTKQILQILEISPLITLDQISQQLNQPLNRIKKIFTHLPRNFFSVIAIPDFFRLNYDLVEVFLDCDPNTVEMVKFLRDFPWIFSHSKCAGKLTGQYLRLYISKTEPYPIEELFLNFKFKNIINDFQLYGPFEEYTFSRHSFINLIDQTSSNTFNFKKWFNQEKEEYNYHPSSALLNKTSPNSEDLIFLNLFLRHPRQSLTDFQQKLQKKKINLPLSLIKQKLTYIQQHYINHYQINYQNPICNHFITIAIKVEGKEELISQMFQKMVFSPVLFSSHFFSSKYSFFWLLFVHPHILKQVLAVLTIYYNEICFYFLQNQNIFIGQFRPRRNSYLGGVKS